MAFLAILFSVVITIVTGIYFLFKQRYKYWTNRGVVNLEPEIPYGSIRRGGKRRHILEVFDENYKEFKGKAPFAGLFFFVKPIPMAIDLDLVHHIMVKDFNTFHDRGVFYNERDDPLSAHLFSLGGRKWKILRAKLTPTFTSGKMKFMYPTIIEVMDRFDQTLSDILKTEDVVEIKDLLARFTTDVIGTCAFGIECNSLKDPNAQFRKAGKMVFENPRNGTLARAFITQFPDLAVKIGMKNTSDEVSSFFMGVVRETVEFREKNNVRRNDFMDLLIQLKNGKSLGGENTKDLENVTLEEIAAQAFVFFLAGFETSSTNMAYSLYELALNPEMQERARQEINNVLEKHNGEFTYDAMMDMTYVDRIINESLRKYPPVFVLMRVANKDFPVPNSDKIIEKDARVFIPVYSIHHDPEIYPDPEVFNPDRFLPDEEQKRHPMAFLGFGTGPRNCIGSRFGQMQSRVGLATLLKNYRFKACSKTSIPIEFSPRLPILTPEGGLWLQLEKIL